MVAPYRCSREPQNSQAAEGTSSPTSTAMPVAEPRRRHVAPRKECQVGAGPTFRVRVEKVIGAGIVLVHAPLDQAHAEDARIEVEVLLRRPRDGGDVMKAVDSAHDNPRDDPKVAKPDRPANDTDRSIKT